MKTYFPVILILLGMISCQTKNKVHTLVPGVGFDNVTVGKTTLDDIIKCYGGKYSVDTFYFKPPLKKEIYSIQIAYDTLGIFFYFYPNEKTIFSISVRPPFLGKTDKGIILGESTFNEIVKAYGKTDWSFSGDEFLKPQRLNKTYDGIDFHLDINGNLTMPDTALSKYLDKKVTEIDIFELKKSTRR